MSNDNSIFGGIETAKTGYESNYIRAGQCEADLGKIELTRNYKKEEFLAIEMTITKVLDDDDGKGHKVGEAVTHLLKVSNANFLGNFKQFAAAALGVDADVVGQAEAERITGDEQPLLGARVGFTARQITTKAGLPFTKVTYAALEEEAKG